MRNTKRGSWFVQELNKRLRLHARDTHLADIMVQVNIRVSFPLTHALGKLVQDMTLLFLTLTPAPLLSVSRSTDT